MEIESNSNPSNLNRLASSFVRHDKDKQENSNSAPSDNTSRSSLSAQGKQLAEVNQALSEIKSRLQSATADDQREALKHEFTEKKVTIANIHSSTSVADVDEAEAFLAQVKSQLGQDDVQASLLDLDPDRVAKLIGNDPPSSTPPQN